MGYCSRSTMPRSLNARVGPLRRMRSNNSNKSLLEETRVKASTMEKMIPKSSNLALDFTRKSMLLSSPKPNNSKLKMQKVESKVDRSGEAPLTSLSQANKIAGKKGSATFKEQMGTIAGDAILSAAFLAYSELL